MAPQTSVVIVQFGSRFLLDRCLESLNRTDPGIPFDVKVVVNGISEGTSSDLSREYPAYQFITNAENRGYAAAANQGLNSSDAEFVVLLNNDVVFSNLWLKHLVDLAESDKSIALVQPKIRSLTSPNTFDYAGGCGGFIDRYGYPFARGRLFTSVEVDHGQYDLPCEIFWASGAALLMRREAVIAAGGFDPLFFIYHEETDLAWRLHLLGFKVMVCPESVVYHEGSASFKASQESSNLQLFMMHRNDLLMLTKNLGSKELRFRLPIRLLLEVVNFGFSLFRKRREAIQIARALLWVTTHVDVIREARNRTQTTRRIPDRAFGSLFALGIAPLLFFLAHRTKFTQFQFDAPTGP